MSAASHTEQPLRAGSSQRPSRVPFQALCLIAAACGIYLLVHYLASTGHSEVAAASQIGRDYGLAGVLFFTLAAIYPLRRFVYRLSAARLEWWYRGHLLVGSLALILLGCHCGFAFRSAFLAALQVGFWGTVLTGLYGYACQWYLTRALNACGYPPLVPQDLEAQRVAAGAALAARAATAPGLEKARRELSRRKGSLWPVRESAYWSRLASEVSSSCEAAEESALLADWARLEAQGSYHRVLRGWTTVHLLFTVVTVQLVLWHLWIVATHPR